MSSDDQDLDDLLESALDDFKHVDINRASSSDTNNQASVPDDTQSLLSSSVWQGPEGSIPPQPREEGSGASSSSPSLPVKGLGLGLSGLQPMKKNKEASSKSKPKREKRGESDGGVGQRQKSLSSTLDKLAEQTQQTVDNMDLGEESLNGVADNLLKELEALGGSEDVQSIMDNMMRQLLSKEILHGPMQEIGDRYPSWLEANRNSLSQDDLDRYTQQHKYIGELCRVYESTPEDFDQIVDLMQQMQKCGQPPADIIKELAPGVKIGEDGVPILDESTPGGEGFPPNCGMM